MEEKQIKEKGVNSGKQGIPFKQLKRLSTGNVVQ